MKRPTNAHTQISSLSARGGSQDSLSGTAACPSAPVPTFADRMYVYDSEPAYMSSSAADFPRLETGGELFGYFSRTGRPVVSLAIGPGRKARRTATSFFQDRDYLRSAGNALFTAHGLQHIGEWHSHHALGLREPSRGDQSTIAKALRETPMGRFLLVIVTLEQGRAVVSPYIFVESSSACHVPSVVVLPGESPVRQSVRRAGLPYLYRPRTSHFGWTTPNKELT